MDEIQLFGDEIDLELYFAWERKIQKTYLLIIKFGNFYFVKFCF